MTNQTIRLRASLAPTWLTCSVLATHRAIEGRSDGGEAIEVATQFGHIVHAGVTGHKAPAPGLIIYDEHTRTHRELERQSADAIEKARVLLAGSRVRSREIELKAKVTVLGVTVLVFGTIDLVVENGDGTIDLLDLKTGRIDQRSALAQMAVYAWLAEKEGWKLRDVVLLRIPRASYDTACGQISSVLRRPASSLINHALATIRFVALASQSPVAAPGLHCGWCKNVACVFSPENDRG